VDSVLVIRKKLFRMHIQSSVEEVFSIVELFEEVSSR
jgi:hypothetical protein